MLDLIRRAFGLGSRPGDTAHDGRWVVLDVETSGLDQSSDALLAIGAVAVHGECVVVEDSLELFVRPPNTSARDNILIHGIGEETQRGGLPPDEAAYAFVDYVRFSPLVAFHASFDRSFLARGVRNYAGVRLQNAWLDLAELAPALYPDVKAKALDEWLEHFDITVEQRHNACSDALATAMLFLKLLASVDREGREPRKLQRLAAQAKWLAK